MNKVVENIQRVIIFISGFSTVAIVILIILFLFKYGFSFIGSKPVSEPISVITSSDIKLKSLKSEEILKIFDGDITNWNQIGGENKEIQIANLDQIVANVTEEELGANMENLPKYINLYFSTNQYVISYLPQEYIKKDFPGSIIELKNIGVSDIVGKKWLPTASPLPQFGMMPLILGTFLVSILGILIAIPLSLMVAIYLAEIASLRVKNIIKPLIELLAGIPSVVYGFFGLVVIVPLVQKTFGLDVGETAFTGSIILATMALPTIITITEDSLTSIPKELRESSYALGANKWQTIYKVLIPYASSGILSAIVLGIGRAIGETMAILMVTGNAAIIPHSIFDSVRTIPATIAAELGEAPYEKLHFNALFTLGCVLFIITMAFNLLVNYIKDRNNKFLN
ncbi:MAG: phosphate ABC transporter permease subunit PstC [Solirubrobacteraceae bacterium]